MGYVIGLVLVIFLVVLAGSLLLGGEFKDPW